MVAGKGPDQRAGKQFRVTRRGDISRLFQDGRRASDRLIALYGLRREEPAEVSRAGVVVTARHGNAVRRNRLKRLCREAFRLIRHELPGGWDYMIVPRVGAELTVGSVQGSLRKLTGRLAGEAGGAS